MLARRLKRRLRELPGANVVVHLESRRSVAGVLTGCWDDSLSLKASRILVEGSGAHAIDGEIVIPHRAIDFVQVGVPIDDARLPA